MFAENLISTDGMRKYIMFFIENHSEISYRLV